MRDLNRIRILSLSNSCLIPMIKRFGTQGDRRDLEIINRHADELNAEAEDVLTNFISKLPDEKIKLLDKALKAALRPYDD